MTSWPSGARVATFCDGAILWARRERRARDEIQVLGEHLNLLAKVDYEVVSEIADRIAKAYKEEQIDSVYLIFNEFKSVISQRLIAQRILPVQELGQREVTLAEELT